MQKIVWDKPKLYIGDKLVEDTTSTLSLESIPFEEPKDNIDISNLTFTCEVMDLNYDFLKSFLFKEKNLLELYKRKPRKYTYRTLKSK